MQRRQRSLACAFLAMASMTPAAGAEPTALERVGNPFASQWPDDPYARNIWTMRAFEGSLYLGAGNSSNVGPSQNAGPVPVVAFDGEAFATAFTADDEQVTVFYADGDVLAVPGHDAREDWSFGNIYRGRADDWRKLRTVPRGLHVYDLRRFAGRLVAAGGAYGQPFDAWFSDDDGESWRPAALSPNPAFASPEAPGGAYQRLVGGGLYGRCYTLFEIGASLFASCNAPLAPAGTKPPEDRTPPIATLFRYDGKEGFEPLAFQPMSLPADRRETFVEAGVDLFPGLSFPADDPRRHAPRVERATAIGETTLYIGAWPHNDHQWVPFGLFLARAPHDARRVRMPAGFAPYDILAAENAVYVLANKAAGERGFKMSVLKATAPALTRWTPVLTVETPALARSFAILGDYLYFGLGTEISEPELMDADGTRKGGAKKWDAEMSAASGDVFRIRLDALNGTQ